MVMFSLLVEMRLWNERKDVHNRLVHICIPARHLHRNKKIIELRRRTVKEYEKRENCSYKELPRDEELPVVDLGREFESFKWWEWLVCPVIRRRDTNDNDKSLDEGCFSHSDCKHWSNVGRSDDLIDKHCSINCIHSKINPYV